MQTVICLPVQSSVSPVPAAKASGGNGGDFMQTLAGIMRSVGVEQGGTGRRVHTASVAAYRENEEKANADTPDTGGGTAAALSQPLMASLIMAVQAGGAQAQAQPAGQATAGGENLPARDQALNSGLAATATASGIVAATSAAQQGKGADMSSVSTGSGVIAQGMPQGMADAAAVTGKQPDFGVDAGNLRVSPAGQVSPTGQVSPAGQAGTADESSIAQPNVKGGAFKENPAAQSADLQANATQAMNLQTGIGTITGSVKAAAFTTRPEVASQVQIAVKPQTPADGTQAGHDAAPQGSVLQGAQSVSPAADGIRHTAGDTGLLGTAPPHTQSAQTTQQPAVASAAYAADENAKGVQSVSLKASVFTVRAKDEPNESARVLKLQAGVSKQDGADIPQAVKCASGAKEGQGGGLAKDDNGKGSKPETADGSSTAIGILGVKSGQVSGTDAFKAKQPDVPDLAGQLTDACRSAADQGQSEIRVHLSPETLGGINIKIVSQNGALSLQISADSRRTGEMLQSNLAELSRSMRDNGVNMNKVEVYYSHSGAFDASAGSFGGRQRDFDGGSGSAATWIPVAQAKDDIDPGLLNNGRMSIFA